MVNLHISMEICMLWVLDRIASFYQAPKAYVFKQTKILNNPPFYAYTELQIRRSNGKLRHFYMETYVVGTC